MMWRTLIVLSMGWALAVLAGRRCTVLAWRWALVVLSLGGGIALGWGLIVCARARAVVWLWRTVLSLAIGGLWRAIVRLILRRIGIVALAVAGVLITATIAGCLVGLGVAGRVAGGLVSGMRLVRRSIGSRGRSASIGAALACVGVAKVLLLSMMAVAEHAADDAANQAATSSAVTASAATGASMSPRRL